jgi:ParB family chromosome partitioning protein
MQKTNSPKEFSERQKSITLKEIPISQLKISRYNPRESTLTEDIEEFANNVKNEGIIQPIVVRNEDGKYEVVAGARRLEAAKKAPLPSVPCLIRDLTDREAQRIGLEENLHRKDLDVRERAIAIKKLLDIHEGKVSKIAKLIGVSDDTLREWLAPLQVEEDILKVLKPARGRPSQKKIKFIASLPKAKQAAVAEAIKDKPISDAMQVVNRVKTFPEEEVTQVVDKIEEMPKGRNITVYFEAPLVRGIENARSELQMDDKAVVKLAVQRLLRERRYV